MSVTKGVCVVCGKVLGVGTNDIHSLSSEQNVKDKIKDICTEHHVTVQKLEKTDAVSCHACYLLLKTIIRIEKQVRLFESEIASKLRRDNKPLRCPVMDIGKVSSSSTEKSEELVKIFSAKEKNERIAHLREQLLNSEPTDPSIIKLPCSKCNYIAKNRADLRSHRYVHQLSQYQCSACDLRFMGKRPYSNHLRGPCGWLTLKNTSTTKRRQVLQRLVCEECGRQFKSKSGLEAHQLHHKGIYKMHCKYCGKGFNFTSSYKLHLRIHSTEMLYICEACGSTFRHRNSLQLHQTVRHGFTSHRKHLCAECGKEFPMASHLNTHIKRYHTLERPYVCMHPGCSFRFVTRNELKRHTWAHTREYPHTCRICKKGCRSRLQLEKHMRRHDEDNCDVRLDLTENMKESETGFGWFMIPAEEYANTECNLLDNEDSTITNTPDGTVITVHIVNTELENNDDVVAV